MNQKQRRRNLNKPKYTSEERIAQGKIFPHDLERAHMEGFTEGFTAGQRVVKNCYAALCLSLNKQHHFGKKRLTRLLTDIDEQLQLTYDDDQLAEEVLKKFGIQIEWKTAEDEPDDVFESQIKEAQ